MAYPPSLPITSPGGIFLLENGVPVFIDSMTQSHRYDVGHAMAQIFALGFQAGRKSQAEEMQLTDKKFILLEENQKAHLVQETSQRAFIHHPPPFPAKEIKEKSTMEDEKPLAMPPIHIEESTVSLTLNLELIQVDDSARFIKSQHFSPSLSNEVLDFLVQKLIEEPAAALTLFLSIYENLMVKESINHLKTSTQGKPAELKNILISLLKKELPDFSSALVELSKALSKEKWKLLKKVIDQEIKRQCQSVTTCLQYGRCDLANSLILAAIKRHRVGHANPELIEDVLRLQSLDQGIALARERLMELLQRDPHLVNACQEVLLKLTAAVYQKKHEHFEHWCIFLFNLDNLPKEVCDQAAEFLAHEQIEHSISIDFFRKKTLLKSWLSRESEVSARAYWLSLENKILTEDKESQELLWTFLPTLRAPIPETNQKNQQRLGEGIKHFLLAWGELPLENPLTIGPLFSSLWNLYCAQAEPLERLKVLAALERKCQRLFLNDHKQLMAYIKALLLEFENNPHFLSIMSGNLFLSVSLHWLLKCKPMEPLTCVALAERVWKAFLSKPMLKNSLLTNESELEKTSFLLAKLWEGMGKEKELKELSSFIFYERLLLFYGNALHGYIQNFRDSFPVNFVEMCLEAQRRELNPISEDQALDVAQFYSRGRRIFAETLLKIWNEPLSPSKFLQLTSIRHLKAFKEHLYEQNPVIVKEHEKLFQIFLQSALTGLQETWIFFKSHQESLGFTPELLKQINKDDK